MKFRPRNGGVEVEGTTDELKSLSELVARTFGDDDGFVLALQDTIEYGGTVTLVDDPDLMADVLREDGTEAQQTAGHELADLLVQMVGL